MMNAFVNAAEEGETFCTPAPNDDDVAIDELPRHNVVSMLSLAGGKMLFGFRRVVNLDYQEFMRVLGQVQHVIHWHDILILILCGWFLVPLVGIFHSAVRTHYEYEKSYTKLLTSHLQQVVRLTTIVYLADITVVALVAIGFDFERLNGYSLGLARTIFTVWVASRLSALKKYFFDQAAETRNKGQLGLIDKAVDVVLYMCSGFILLDIFDVQTSIFAFGSAGTLIVGLASKDLAEMFVNGVAMTTADRVREGDCVSFGDGTSGDIVKIGWMQTTIRHYDDLIEHIPNSSLGLQRVVNMSRIQQCQVKVNLRFKLKDGNKMEKLANDVLEEIKAVCPEVVVDGSRPFRAVWTDIKEYYLNLMIDTHYALPSMGTPYWNNRHRVMKAIYKCVESNKMEFAEPPALAAPM